MGKNYSTKDILKDELVKEYIESTPLSKETIRAYGQHIRNFCNFLDTTPTEIIEKYEAEQDAAVKSRKRSVKRDLNGFSRFLEEQDYAPLTISRHIGGVKSFLKFFDIDTPRIKTAPVRSSTIKDLPTMEDVKLTLKYSNARDRAIILLHISSGMSKREIIDLLYSDFTEAINAPINAPIEDLRNYIDDHTIPTFIIGRQKVRDFEFVTFCSPETTFAIVEYLEERGSMREALFTTNRGKKLSQRTYDAIFSRLNDRCKFGKKRNGKARKFTSHQLRRLFASNMLGEGIKKEQIDFMMGHVMDPTSAAYFKAKPEKLKAEYIKGLNSVTFAEITVVEFLDEETQKMREELKDVKMELELQRKVIKQLNDLKNYD